MIDQIVPLSIGIASSPGSYAIFIGSGVSKSAGIPTGKELLLETKQRIYRMSVRKIESPPPFEEWQIENEIDQLNYSRILESVGGGLEERRAFLADFFEGKDPTESHKRIVDLVSEELIKVIVTTNFDQLLENELRLRNIEFDVVSSPEDIKRVRLREHSNCWILKIHGDYQKTNIRNTEEELRNLDKEMVREFIEILVVSQLRIVN